MYPGALKGNGLVNEIAHLANSCADVTRVGKLECLLLFPQFIPIPLFSSNLQQPRPFRRVRPLFHK